MKNITHSFVDEHARFRQEKWRQPFENQASSPIFSMPLGEQTFEFTKWLTPQQIWDRYATLSQVLVLDEAEKQVRTY